MGAGTNLANGGKEGDRYNSNQQPETRVESIEPDP